MEKDCDEVHYFLVKSKDSYLMLKGTDDEFEVIHNLKKEKDHMFLIQDLPWFVSLSSELLPNGFDITERCGHDFRWHRLSSLLAFDREKKLVRRTIYLAFKDTKFRFYAWIMEEETLSQLIDMHVWDYWNFYSKKKDAFTLHTKS